MAKDMTNLVSKPVPVSKPVFTPILRRYGIVIALLLGLVIAAVVAFNNYRAEIVKAALQKVVDASAGRLTLSEPRQSKSGAIAIDTVRWKDAKLDVAITDAQFDIGLGSLIDSALTSILNRQLRIDTIKAAKVSVDFAPSNEAFVLPPTLALPLGIQISQATVDELLVQQGRVRLTALSLVGGYSAGQYLIKQFDFKAGPVSYSGSGTMRDAPPYLVQTKGSVKATLQRPDGEWPVKLSYESKGELQRHDVQLNGTFRDLPIAASTQISPFTPELIGEVRAKATQFNLATWLPQLTIIPNTQAQLEFKGEPLRDELNRPLWLAWRGELQAINSLLGKVDDKKLALGKMAGKLDVDLRSGSQHFAWSALTAQVATAQGDVKNSVITGSLDWTPSRFKTDVQLVKVDAAQFFASSPTTELSGKLSTEGSVISFDLTQGQSKLRFSGKAQRFAPVWQVDDVVATLPSASGQEARLNFKREDNKRYAVAGTLKQVDVSLWLEELSRLNISLVPNLTSLKEQLAGLSLIADGPFAVSANGPNQAITLKYESVAGSLKKESLRGLVSGVLSGTANEAVDRVQNVDLQMAWRATTFAAKGDLGKAGDSLQVNVASEKLPLLLQGTAAAEQVGGALKISGQLLNDLQKPDFSLSLTSAALAILAKGKPAFTLQDFVLNGKGNLANQSFDIAFKELGQNIAAQGAGQFNVYDLRWQGQLAKLQASGKYELKMEQALELDVSPKKVVVANGALLIDGGRFDLNRFNWQASEPGAAGSGLFELKAKTVNLPVERILYWLQATAPAFVQKISAWRITADVDLRGQSPETLSGKVDASVSGEGVSGSKGQIQIGNGQLSGGFEIALGSMASLSQPLGPEWRIDGELSAKIQVSGKVTEPKIDAMIDGKNVVLEQKSLGWRMREGIIRARVTPELVTVENLTFKVGTGSLTMKGQQRIVPTDSKLSQAELGKFSLVANKVSLPLSPEQRVVLSGTTEVVIRNRSLLWSGKLVADEGLIELRNADAPVDPSDVVIVRDAKGQVPTLRASKPGSNANRALGDDSNGAVSGINIAADLQIDLGQKIRVLGSGVDARLQGTLNLKGALPEAPRVIGTVTVSNGTYLAYGQRLDIERGRLVFSGQIDNPTLDIVALRKRLPVEAGVSLSGTALNPQLKLVSVPTVPDSEKLSWLVLGVGLENSRDNAQNAALQAAASTLVGEGGSLSNSVAKTLGLDVLSVRAAPLAGLSSAPIATPSFASSILNPNTSLAQQNVVTLGKRLSSRLYISYEQGLRGVWNLLRIQYDISNRLSVRAQTGSESAVDLLLFYPFD